MLYALNQNSKKLDDLIINNACVPVSPNGKMLKRPSQLVNPKKEASSLFFPDDGRFPSGDESTFRNPQVLAKLEVLGMDSHDLPWENIAERAESVQRVNLVDSKAAVKRAKFLIEFVQKKLKVKNNGSLEGIISRIVKAEFLPVLERPKSFPLRWKSEDYRTSRRLLAAPKDVFLPSNKYLVCCTELVVDLEIPKKVRESLRLHEKRVTTEHVMKQLSEAVSASIGTMDRKSLDEVSRVCTEAYSFLQENIASCTSSVEVFLSKRPFILVGRRFLSADEVAFEVKTDCSPFLNKLPENLSDSYSKLLRFSGVREQFEAKDYISGLLKIKQQFGETQPVDRTLQVAVNMAIKLGETVRNRNEEWYSEEESSNYIYLPDSGRRMLAVADLCYKDCPWMPDDRDEQFIHEKIPWSTCEQLGVKTRREGALQQHDIGFPFGQKEELTNRLKRILTGYPGEKEILKELLQNADDAQATEICFIKDPRHHPDERVFQESWKPLQGPALCVYNNRPFTNADIEGICNLGKGSKGEDPNKTGQYGVGFNAVYHLTDVPSFRSKGEEIGDVFCVFDPHCKYAPCASDAKPGRMYKDNDKLKKKFPDVFPCYPEKLFPIKNSTMFRFPLKSQEMAEDSKISKKPVSVHQLDRMMKDLKMELFEVLLFVNNVRKISIAEINRSAKLAGIYSVEVVMTKEDESKRQRFADYMKQVGKQAKHKDFLPTSIKPKKCIYTMTLRDSVGEEETWLIVQQVGFEKPVQKSIDDAFRDENLGMLPRGGVACLLSSSRSAEQRRGKEGKAYCFLPLPFKTNLPVYINGHFALDHEARRNLWRDEAGGYRSDWNKALLRDVITSCYLTLLEKVRGYIQLPVGQDAADQYSTLSKSGMTKTLTFYEGLFPRYPFEDSHWKLLADSVYKEMCKKETPLIPVVRCSKADSGLHTKNFNGSARVQVTWFPPQGTGERQTHFNNLEIKGYFSYVSPKPYIGVEERIKKVEFRIKEKNRFEEMLLETGFNLVALSVHLFYSFREAGVEVCCVSPLAVMDFFKSFSDSNPLCSIGDVPCPVHKSPFKDVREVIRILKYCKGDDQFLENLEGLPLLLTQDNYLRVFSKSEPRCLSHYWDILPQSTALFVHKEALSDVFNIADWKKTSVFRSLDIEIFSSQLHLTLPERFCTEHRYIRWYPEDDPQSTALPNRRWIFRVWYFLQKFFSDKLKDLSAEELKDFTEEKKTSFARNVLVPALASWCIVPATGTRRYNRSEISSRSSIVGGQKTGTDHFLVPLNIAGSVLDFKDCGQSSETLVEALRCLGLPELNSPILSTPLTDSTCYTKVESYELARNLVATMKTPHSLLKALNQKLKTDPSSLDGKLKCKEAIKVLEYFGRNTKALVYADGDIVKNLPFFPKASGQLGKVQDRDVFVLPDGIPKTEMVVVEEKLHCFFVEPWQSLLNLYEFLKFQQVTPSYVYLNFILKCFQYLSFEGKLDHLLFLRAFLSSVSATENESEDLEQKQLKDSLKRTEIIPARDGSWKTASNFYDPRNKVFFAMLSKDSFPPKPFNSGEWLSFFEKVGLIKDVSGDDFVNFANQVAREAKSERTKETFHKSHVLVQHLFSRPNVVGEGLLHRVCDIPFVVADPVEESLEELCTPFWVRQGAQIPFIAFKDAVFNEFENIVWTKAHLLPESADPRNHRYELSIGCNHRNVDQYLKAFITQLCVRTKPSVGLVISHCQTVTARRNITADQSPVITRVMESIYAFLQENAIKDHEAKVLLETTRFILVEGGNTFILPKQAVIELYESLEIKPFLYRIPPVFGKFQALFEFVGCSQTATCAHYTMVLEMMHRNCKVSKLIPNEVTTCEKAVKGFFDHLQDDSGAVSTLSRLYLPAMPSKFCLSNVHLKVNTIPVTLHQSAELLFDDDPSYGNRITSLNQLFVLELSLMGVRLKSAMVNFSDLVLKLPSAVQPRMLSTVVKEKIEDPKQTKIVKSGVVSTVKQQISSIPFVRGVARIIRHVNYQNQDFDERVIESIEKGLRSIELFAVEGLRTSLFFNEVQIPGSEADVPYFVERREQSGVGICRVYIDALSDMNETISTISHVIEEMYGEFLQRKAYLIGEMLRCPPSSIRPLLDRRRIRKDDSYTTADLYIYPEPGTLIPIEDHHLLKEAFEEFEAGEYVGYQLHDPNLA